ncbi:hypothetical protein J2Z43_002589 [Clostridioides mangenotii]|uniref:Uncharacterized protein n=1 Tax=Metaclostridioides mangenotii TaxID=1540 RepID=A0ABS4EDY0_9FIRM|nr:hypothetical protein [Clostridioides mangenotii]
MTILLKEVDSMDVFDEKGIKPMLIAEMQEDLIDL